MGCGNAKKEIENQMMIMQLERVNIQMERAKNLKLLEDIDGIKRKTISIPDYIDPKFSQQRNKSIKSEPSPLIKGGKEIRSSKTIKRINKTVGKKVKKSKKTTSNGNND